MIKAAELSTATYRLGAAEPRALPMAASRDRLPTNGRFPLREPTDFPQQHNDNGIRSPQIHYSNTALACLPTTPVSARQPAGSSGRTRWARRHGKIVYGRGAAHATINVHDDDAQPPADCVVERKNS